MHTVPSNHKKNKFAVNWKQVNREMIREAAKFPDHMQEIPYDEWPEHIKNYGGELKPIGAWRSKKFFAQIVEEPNGAIRISINRARFNDKYDYDDGITWDELFAIKNQIGFADKDCIEIYPAAHDLVNVANIRHLFVLDTPHPYNWRAQKRI